jgi:purine-nucleoside phosphorylase
MYAQVMESVEYLRKKLKTPAKTVIILGSGLGGLVNFIERKITIPYAEIPHFPKSVVEGHAGTLIAGQLAGTEVLVMNGRFLYYQGYSMREVTYPLYVFQKLNVENLLVSNAAGGINATFLKGTLMILTDFINFFGVNPLIGILDQRFGPQFPDMSQPFSANLIKIAKETAAELGISYREGVYLGTAGPSYESVAEIQMMQRLGADVVGMSTVPEVIVGNYLGLKILGISCITNLATGLSENPHDHHTILQEAQKMEKNFCQWMLKIIQKLR